MLTICKIFIGKTILRVSFVSFTTLICTLNAFSEDADEANMYEENELIGNLLLDRTITPFGKDFFYRFTEAWRSNNGDSVSKEAVHVSVLEKIIPQSRSIIQIRVDNRIIYQNVISMRNREKIIESAQGAMNTTLNHLLTRNQSLSGNPDIADSAL